MSAERWIVVRNWEKFQHYRDRDPTWIKVYVALSGDADWEGLTLAERGVLVGVWIEYARRAGVVAESSLRRQLVHTENDARRFRSHLETLIEAGFLEVSASRPLALRYPRDRVRDREEKESPPTPPRSGGTRANGKNPRAQTANAKVERHERALAEAWERSASWDETRTDILHERLDAVEEEFGAILSDQERDALIDHVLGFDAT